MKKKFYFEKSKFHKVVIATTVSYFVKFDQRWDVKIVGELKLG
jgi:hypothetical protein